MGLVLLESASMTPDEECGRSVLLNGCSSGREGRIWNMLLGNVRVFDGIVAINMGLSGRGGSALKSNSDLFISVRFYRHMYGGVHDAVLVSTV
jgi:hypothetical protein